MPHRPEARRFAPQVRSVFHFRLHLFASFCLQTIKIKAFSALIVLCKVFSLYEKGAVCGLQGFAVSIFGYVISVLIVLCKVFSLCGKGGVCGL